MENETDQDRKLVEHYRHEKEWRLQDLESELKCHIVDTLPQKGIDGSLPGIPAPLLKRLNEEDRRDVEEMIDRIYKRQKVLITLESASTAEPMVKRALLKTATSIVKGTTALLRGLTKALAKANKLLASPTRKKPNTPNKTI